MSENRIKSAWEIALEKAEKLGKLSPEEEKKRLEDEFLPRGKALAERYLKGLPARDLERELNRYENEKEKDMVRMGLLTVLVSAIALDEAKKALQAMEGISLINSSPRVLEIIENIAGLLEKYKDAKEQLYISSEESIATKIEFAMHKFM